MSDGAPPRHHSYWTEEEDKRLLALVRAGLSTRHMAKTMGRSYRAIQNRRSRLVKQEGDVHNQTWKPHEVNYLLTTAGNTSRRAIAEHLGRTESSVKYKLFSLGVTSRQGRHTLRGMARLFGVSKSFMQDARERSGATWCRRGGRLATDADVVRMARWMLDPENDVRASVTVAHLRRIVEEYGDAQTPTS